MGRDIALRQVDIAFSGRRAHRFLTAALGVLLALQSICVAGHLLTHGSASTTVVIRGTPESLLTIEKQIRSVGGRIDQRLPIIDGVRAAVPAAFVPSLRSQPWAVSITPDEIVHPLDSSIGPSGYDPTTDVGSMYSTTKITGARAMWKAGYTGKGVDIALIDSGVVPIDGLSGPSKVVLGPDFSVESQATNLVQRDSFGHGTHLAGIIAGHDTSAVGGKYSDDKVDFLGMAPDARLVAVRVADSQGITDLSQIIAGLDWIYQHRTDNGLNIRIVNLSFGTDSGLAYQVDPLCYAVERLWRAGVAVVVAAGNSGSRGLTDPARDPFVIAVGAANTNGTESRSDDTLASFSSLGTSSRPVDLIAPGVHIESLRDPGSNVDLSFAGTGRINARFFRGSGTSQAAAVVSGAAALLLQQRPSLTPDELKQLLMSTARNLPSVASKLGQGRGELDLEHAMKSSVGSYSQHYTLSSGAAAVDVAGNSWAAGHWNGNSWTGNSWTGNSWTGNSWTGNSWTGNSWTGNSWTSGAWAGNSWTCNAWTALWS